MSGKDVSGKPLPRAFCQFILDPINQLMKYVFYTRFECIFQIFSTRLECSFKIFSTRLECIFTSSPLVSSVVIRAIMNDDKPKYEKMLTTLNVTLKSAEDRELTGKALLKKVKTTLETSGKEWKNTL